MKLRFGVFDSGCLIVVLCYILKMVRCESLLQSITETIGAENYTYFRISRSGHLRLQLESLTGDADLYISDKVQRPTFDNYELQSTTCGTDILEIPQSYNRPIGVAVYGHPSQIETRYRLTVYVVSDDEQQDYNYFDALYNEYPGEHGDKYERPPRYKPSQTQTEEEDGESIVWNILVTILKVVFEILL